MQACVATCIFVMLAIALTDVHPAVQTRKKGSRKRSALQHRSQEGKRQAFDLLRHEASPQLQSLAGIQPSQSVDVFDGDDPDEVAREDDVHVDIASFRALWMAYIDGESVDESGLSPRIVMDFIMDWLGRPYRFGGTGTEGIDCSAFLQQLFRHCGSLVLPRTAQEQFTYGIVIERTDQLQFGDIVFFHTRPHARVSHVGIYIGDGLFAHASSRYGVTISSLQSTYYNRRFLGGRRLTAGDFQQLALRSELQ